MNTQTTPSVRWALAGLALSMLMPSLDTSIANAGLPVLARELSASFQAVQWIVLAYLLAITTLVVGAGRLGDLFGRRRLLLAGIATFTCASLLCGAAPTLWFLIAARAVQGFGAAIMLALTVASVNETVPKDRTGSTMGLLGTVSAIGTTLGPSLGGVLMAAAGWRAIFLINIPIGLVNLALAYRFLPADRESGKTMRTGFDFAGMLALAATLAAYALAMTAGHGRWETANLALLFASVCGVALFVGIESRAAAPLVQLSTLRDRNLAASLAMTALVATVMMSTLVVGPFYLSAALGRKAAAAGLALSAGPLAAALAGIPAGRLVDRFGSARMTIAGLGGMAAGCAALSQVPLVAGIIGYLAPIVCVTSSYALFQAANNTSVMTSIAAGERGVVSGMLNLSRNLGLITGASVMGAVFAAATTAARATKLESEAVAAGMQVTFGTAAGLVGVGLAIAMVARRHRQPRATANFLASLAASGSTPR